ncbi:MAG: glycine cleavage system protein GcvH [Candidatus Diapherotrites archaeon]|nr:glycine cleavage system protein GcvH [Candidatus Diapherotrites archaeon]
MAENPANLKYTKDHEWIRIEGNNGTIGITDFAQHSLTDIVFVEFPEVGKKAERGKSLAIVESVKSVSDVFAPVSSEVTGVNKELESKPQLVNEDPFGKGWMVKIKILDQKQLSELMSKEQYDHYLSEQKH